MQILERREFREIAKAFVGERGKVDIDHAEPG